MVNIRSTGALWLDVIFLGISFLALLLLLPLVLWANPSEALDPNFRAFVFGFTVIGIGIVAIGLWVGRRTRWKVPDSKVAKTR